LRINRLRGSKCLAAVAFFMSLCYNIFMENATRYFETNSTDPAFNLAFEEYLLLHKREGNILMLWQNDNAVVVGLNQNAYEEVNLKYAAEHDVKIVRRTTGGGAVYHDIGNLNYSFITSVGNDKMISLERFSRPVLDALKSLGITAEVSGRNDITVDGKKVSGTAQRVCNGRVLHHGTLLFSSDTLKVAAVLTADKSKFLSKSTKSVESRVANIYDYLPVKIDIDEFWAHLRREIDKNAAICTLTDVELAEVERLATDKYRSNEWTFGKAPRFSYSASARFAGGTLKTAVLVEKNCIKEIYFIGDFMATAPIDGLTQALTGCPYNKSAVLKVLLSFPLSELLGNITADEVISTIFS
jgi:lipoyltransferase and lipoate-protein ligase